MFDDGTAVMEIAGVPFNIAAATPCNFPTGSFFRSLKIDLAMIILQELICFDSSTETLTSVTPVHSDKVTIVPNVEALMKYMSR